MLHISTGKNNFTPGLIMKAPKYRQDIETQCNFKAQTRENDYMGCSVPRKYRPTDMLRTGLNDRRNIPMKTVRIREKIKKFLAEKPRNTAEILEHINSTMRHGTTSQQLGNVLSKDKDIVKVGYIKRSGILSGGYDICEWATRIWVSDNCPDWKEGQPLILDNNGNVQTSSDLIRRS